MRLPGGRMHRVSPRRERSLACLVLLPRHRLLAHGERLHRDATLNRAHLRAQIAADARLVNDLDDGAAELARQPADRLVRAVLARRPAELAANAFVLVNRGDEM